MTTVREVVDQVSSLLHSSMMVRENLTSLTETLDATETSFQVADSDRITQGVIEVEDELMYVNMVDGPTVTLFPFGRGYASSVAVGHQPGVPVVVAPLYPRASILRALTQAVNMANASPGLFAAKYASLPRGTIPGVYVLPDDVRTVRWVRQAVPGGLDIPVGAWSVQDGATKQLAAGGNCWYGSQSLNICYAADLTAPSSMDDDIATLGWDESCRDVIVWAAAWQMLQGMEPGRIDQASYAQLTGDQTVAVGDATKVAQAFYAGFAQRKQDVLKTLNERHEIQMHRGYR